MAWVEERKGPRGITYLVRERRDGKKVTLATCDDEHEARYYVRMGKPFPVTSAAIVERLQEGMGSRKKATPKLSNYAYDVIKSDANIGQGSRDAYEATIRNHVEGSLIDKPLDRIEPQEFRTFYNGLTPMKSYDADGKGMKSSVLRILSKVFKQAINDGLIQASPLARSGVKRPSTRRATPIEPMSIDEVEELAAAALTERTRLAVLVAGLCGLRAGEIGGLRVRDVDAAKCRLTVAQAVFRDRSGKHVGVPKTTASRRTITIPCSLGKELGHVVKGRTKGDLIFQTEEGGLVDHVVLGKWVKVAAKHAGIDTHTHLLRHACASLLIDAGANPKQVQVYLGHSNIQTTLDLYAHLFDAAGTDLADRMEARREDYRLRVAGLDI